MIQITEQQITMTVGTAKEIMRKLTLAGLIDDDDNTFTLKMEARGNAEMILPFPHSLNIIDKESHIMD